MSDKEPPPPPPDRDQFGVAALGKRRLRIGWFGRLICEELCEGNHGDRFWRKIRRYETVELK